MPTPGVQSSITRKGAGVLQRAAVQPGRHGSEHWPSRHPPPLAAGGVMSVRGRQGRMDFVDTYTIGEAVMTFCCYSHAGCSVEHGAASPRLAMLGCVRGSAFSCQPQLGTISALTSCLPPNVLPACRTLRPPQHPACLPACRSLPLPPALQGSDHVSHYGCPAPLVRRPLGGGHVASICLALGEQGRCAACTQPSCQVQQCIPCASSLPVSLPAALSFQSRPPQVFRRMQLAPGEEEYRLIGSYDTEPKPPAITDAFRAAWAAQQA